MLMYKMNFQVKQTVVEDYGQGNVPVSVYAEAGDVYVSLDSGVEIQMTPTQAKDLMFSLRKAVYEAQRETRSTKRYQNQYQKGGVQ